MGKPREPEKALLFVGTLYSNAGYYLRAREILTEEFGGIVLESRESPWDYSEYYREEMGWPIFRRFIAFEGIIDPSSIREIKLLTNLLEERLSLDGKRQINLDPGYLTPSKVVLATTKNYAHRVYLGKGIYAEVTLYYRKGAYRAHEFTYRDYGSREYIEFFTDLRHLLMERTG